MSQAFTFRALGAIGFMKLTRNIFSKHKNFRGSLAATLLVTLMLSHAGCFLDEKVEPYYGRVTVPHSQEFHWSDGGLPQTFDPAFAAAPPDTDLVRAIFEGLTDYDPRTLAPVPGVATHWEPSSGGRVWTFYLRADARWSNGEKVTADDFVRSWERTLKIGPLAPHTDLLSNIEGATPSISAPHHFGARAINDHVLQVTLQQADNSFPALVAHPVFRPVKVAAADRTDRLESHELISNGAFHLSETDRDRVRLERAKTYWDGDSVALEGVTFVNSPNAEDALTAYEAGEVDAVTNAPFEPLALKLFTPYKDFHRSTFGALTYYSFNTSHQPFDDVRVREALALAIDRERISRDDLGGSTEPAGKFLPEAMSGEKPVVDQTEMLGHDINKARELLAAAGYRNGEGFPVIRLLINRNEQQRTVAQSIAEMWRSTLNIETEIVVRNWDEYEAAIKTGDYDIVRRGMVMQTTSELINLKMLFERDVLPVPLASPTVEGKAATREEKHVVETEAQALKDLKAMPIYFASAYSLVKPYVSGFDSNVLDAPSLKKTRIETNWKQP